EDANERRRLGLGGRGEDRVQPGLVPPLERAVLVRLALRLDADPALEQHAQAWPRMRVQVRDAARREVDAVAAEHRRLGRALEELPNEGAAFDARSAEM